MSTLSAIQPCQQLHWYALKVRIRSEPIAASVLRACGYEPFLPVQQQRRRYSDRVKSVETALFPGYMFCRFDIRAKVSVLSTPTVEKILGVDGVPKIIEPPELDAIRRMLEAGGRPGRGLEIGQRVRVKVGSLEGIEGILTKKYSEHELCLWVDILKRSVSVRIDADYVEPIQEQAVSWNHDRK